MKNFASFFSLFFLLLIHAHNFSASSFGENSYIGGYNISGYNSWGYDKNGFDKKGVHRETGTKYDEEGYDRYGFNERRLHKETGTKYNEEGYSYFGFNESGYNRYLTPARVLAVACCTLLVSMTLVRHNVGSVLCKKLLQLGKCYINSR